MARKEPDPPLELDPWKGGLKHNPFAALRGKGEIAGTGPAPAAAPGAKPAHAKSGSGKSKPATPPSARLAPATPSVAKPAPAPSQNRISVRIERSGRGGKTVTIVEGPGLAGRTLEPLAREIARGMGTGARVEGSAIVVQGDQRERLVVWLGSRGFGGAVAGN